MLYTVIGFQVTVENVGNVFWDSVYVVYVSVPRGRLVQ